LPGTYSRHVLHSSLYLLVLTSAVSYGAVLLVIDALDRYSESPAMTEMASRSQVIATVVRDRWVWIAPLWATACVLVATLMPQARAANVFMYRFF